MGKSSSAPPAPDYTGAAQAQGAANVEAARATAKLSNPNIVGPLGGQTVTYEGDVPTVTQYLTPEAQKTLDAQQRVQYALSQLGEQGIGTAQKIMGTPFEYQGPEIQTGLGDVGQIQQQSFNPNLQTSLDTSGLAKMPVNAGTTAQQAIMGRLQPQLERQRAQLETQLANQGITRGSEAYNTAMQQQGQQENDLLSQAALQGINLDMAARQQGLGEQQALGGFANQAQLNAFNAAVANQQQQNAAQNQLFNQALSGTQFGNTAAQQALQQQLGLYNQPLNQITALMSGSQIQMPQFQGYQGVGVQAAPLYQAAQDTNKYNMDVYNAQQASGNSALGGLFSLGGSLLGGPAGSFGGKLASKLFGG